MMKKILHGFIAAITSPEAVKAERNLAATVVVRLLLAVGASSSLVALVEHLIKG